ncbi:MAG TPA: myo-inositol 2-dehydrogenase [Legionellales bacterium]|nr:myo-inositol 2-dehydrogenase [Legionellales bacterium]
MNPKKMMIIGAGPMAVDYTKVLKAMDIEPLVIGRSLASCQEFENQTGVKAISGGIEKFLQDSSIELSDYPAIVASHEKNIGEVSKFLMAHGAKKLLVEKPGGFDVADILSVRDEAKKIQADVYVGYNRRFYQSVKKAQQIIAADGGVKSFHFEFTEWSHVISPLKKEEGVKEQWFLSNSTHLIDLAFYLGGKPQLLNAHVGGQLDWHPYGSIFVGAGQTEQGALFSYHSNWEAPGRWSLEVLTNLHRLIFKPLESLSIQNIGSVQIEAVELDNQLDKDFKPGLYQQVEAFLNDDVSIIQKIDGQAEMLYWFEKIRQVNSF